VTAPEDPELRRIARFWDARGKEDPQRYSTPGGVRVGDAAFDTAGEAVLAALEESLGWSAEGAGFVLDLGCGAGRITGSLASRADEVVAADVSPRMLAAARERLGPTENVCWLQAEVGDLPGIEPGVVDAALMLGVLPHLPTVKLITAALQELGRMLRPGGTACFDVRTGPSPLALPGEDDLPGYVADHPLWRGVAVDLETIAAVASLADLAVERIEGSGTARCVVTVARDDF
jgi:SAM-dependent methyltransferase